MVYYRDDKSYDTAATELFILMFSTYSR